MRISDWSSDVCSSDLADNTVREIESFGGKAISVRADVASSEQVQNLFKAATKAFGGVDILVASAGVIVPSMIAEATDDDFDRHFQVNVRGTFNAFRESARQVRDGGRLIGFSSRSEEHTSELQSLMRISYAVFYLQKKNTTQKK